MTCKIFPAQVLFRNLFKHTCCILHYVEFIEIHTSQLRPRFLHFKLSMYELYRIIYILKTQIWKIFHTSKYIALEVFPSRNCLMWYSYQKHKIIQISYIMRQVIKITILNWRVSFQKAVNFPSSSCILNVINR